MNEVVISDAWAAMEDFLADRRRRIPYLQREKAELDRKYEMRYEREEGREEGALSAKKRIAANLLRMGSPIADVAKAAELPVEDIQKIAAEISPRKA